MKTLKRRTKNKPYLPYAGLAGTGYETGYGPLRIGYTIRTLPYRIRIGGLF
jgi:hypothetical protein